MISEYEVEIAKFFKRAVPDLKELIYANSFSDLDRDMSIKYYPSGYFTRQESDMVFPKRMDVQDTCRTHVVTSFFQNEYIYSARIYVEKQIEALNLQNQIRFYFADNPQVLLPWPEKDDVLQVQLRFLYIKVIDERTNKDQKGARRCVEVSWRSVLAITKDYRPKVINKIILRVNKEEIITKTT